MYNFISFPDKPKVEEKKYSILDFEIDTSHYRYYGPRVVRVIDIDY